MFNVLILGSGRSGTSMVAGSLRRAGYFMGEQLYAPRDANPLGFFEDPEINGINEALLAPHVAAEQRLGANQLWLAALERSVAGMPPPAIASRITALMRREPWCFKDPRFCYTLPSWRPWIAAARLVCVFRDPAVTAASIVKECATADYLRGVPFDHERALATWRAMYRQVLADHRHQGDWLFLHYDQVVEGDGLERLGKFLHAPVDRAFPTKELRRSQPTGRIHRENEALYRELCELAGHLPARATARVVVAAPSAPAPIAAPAPELSVLICSYRRKETLLECLRSFDAQTLDPARAELVVVLDGDEDGSADAVRALALRTPLRLLSRRENLGLASARSAAVALARGTTLLLVNDDTIAFPDLLERHLAAHRAQAGRAIAVLGSFEQPPSQLKSALMRVLEASGLVFGYAGLAAGVDHDWMKFWGCNVSVPRAALAAAGAFDAGFRRYGCEDTDLGLRLAQRGVAVRFEPKARAWHRHVLSFDDLARRQPTVARAYVHLFAKHPDALGHSAWRKTEALELRGCEQFAARGAAQRSALDQEARALAAVDCDALERSGEAGRAQAKEIVARLGALLAELNRHWWNDGFAQGMGDLSITRLAELRAWRPAGAKPWPLAATNAIQLLAWPNWNDEGELDALLSVAIDARVAAHRPCLVLRHDARHDGAVEPALERLRRSSERILARGGDVDVLLLDESIAAEELPRLGVAVTCAWLASGSDEGARRRFFARVGAPGVRGVDDLLAWLPAKGETEPARAIPEWLELSV
jgi:GT2 family glycosyltransferase